MPTKLHVRTSSNSLSLLFNDMHNLQRSETMIRYILLVSPKVQGLELEDISIMHSSLTQSLKTAKAQ